jgi:hypothetical protein
MKLPTHGALRFVNSTLRRVNCFVEISDLFWGFLFDLSLD